MLKLQAFLIEYEGHTNLRLTGVFDQATFDAVSSFQMKYFKDILEPWGHTAPTGYSYILTTKKINEIYCQRIFPLNDAQINEIIAFRQLLESLRAQGIEPVFPPSFQFPGEAGNATTSTSTTPLLPIVGQIRGEEGSQGQNLRNLAAVLFAQPGTFLDTMKCLYLFVLVLFVLYALSLVVRDLMYYENSPANQRKRFLVKWTAMSLGLVLAMLVAYLANWWCLILPLLIALIASAIWMLTYPKHSALRASAKSWYLVGNARAKSMWREASETTQKPIFIPPTYPAAPSPNVGSSVVADDSVIILPSHSVPKWPMNEPTPTSRTEVKDSHVPLSEIV